jgi:hypothetical protein
MTPLGFGDRADRRPRSPRRLHAHTGRKHAVPAHLRLGSLRQQEPQLRRGLACRRLRRTSSVPGHHCRQEGCNRLLPHLLRGIARHDTTWSRPAARLRSEPCTGHRHRRIHPEHAGCRKPSKWRPCTWSGSTTRDRSSTLGCHRHHRNDGTARPASASRVKGAAEVGARARRYRFLNEQKAPELSRTGPSTGEVWVAPPHRCTWLRRSEPGCRISRCHLPALGSPSTIPVSVARPPQERTSRRKGPSHDRKRSGGG